MVRAQKNVPPLGVTGSKDSYGFRRAERRAVPPAYKC